MAASCPTGPEPPATPTVSIVMAAYGRPEVIVWAIESIRRQTFQDWELLVVGDGGDEALERAVTAIPERRLTFHNLARNFGEQAGPNNVGMALARGRYLAFLNQDDLWLPDHLRIVLDWLEATAADLVFTAAISVAPASSEALEQCSWTGGLAGRGRNGRYDPVITFAAASTWLMRRRFADAIRFRPARECLAESSQDLLYRAWRRGDALCACPELTAILISSGSRVDSYVTDHSYEQAWFMRAMTADPNFRRRLSAHLQPLMRKPLWQRACEDLLRFAGRFGVEPRGVLYALQGYRRGLYIDFLRRQRGLEPLSDPDSLRWITPRSSCAYPIGESLDFTCGGNGHLYRVSGWAPPEPWGTWTCEKRAQLMFDIRPPPIGDLVLEAEARSVTGVLRPQQHVEVSAEGRTAAKWLFDDGTWTTVTAVIPATAFRSGTQVVVTLDLPDAISPKALGQSTDPRQLGLCLRRIRLFEARS